METNKKIEDFGPKIGGARKDLRGSLRSEDLADCTVEEVSKYATKDYVWPLPDYEEIIRDPAIPDGEADYVVRALKLVRDAIPGSPSSDQTGRADMERYVHAVATLRDHLATVRTRADFRAIWDKAEIKTHVLFVRFDNYSFIGGYSDGPRIYVETVIVPQNWMGYAARRALSSDRGLTKAVEAAINGTIPPLSSLGREMKLNPRWPRRIDAIDKDLAREKWDLVSEDGAFRLARRDNSGDNLIVFSPTWISANQVEEQSLLVHLFNKYPELQPVFKTSVEKGWGFLSDAKAALRAPYEARAEAAIQAKRAAKAAHLSKLKTIEDSADVAQRDWTDGRAITADDYLGAEGLRMRAGEFGNWVHDRERQELLDAGFNAFHDLADMLGVTPDSVSLNGTLAVAFGARGSGSFAGHYEPGRKVINLTKPSGFGVLAHEWGHAFDHWAGCHVEKFPELTTLHPANEGKPYLSVKVMSLNSLPSLLLAHKIEKSAMLKETGQEGTLSDEELALIELADAIFLLKYENRIPATAKGYEATITAQFDKVLADFAQHCGGKADGSVKESFIGSLAIIMQETAARGHKRRMGTEPDEATKTKYYEAAKTTAAVITRDFNEMMLERLTKRVGMDSAGFLRKFQEKHEKSMPPGSCAGIMAYLKKRVVYFQFYHSKACGVNQIWEINRQLPRPEFVPNKFSVELNKLTEYFGRPQEAFARSVETAVAQAFRARGCKNPFLVPLAVADGGKGHPDGEIAANFTKAFLKVVPKLSLAPARIIATDVEADVIEEPLPPAAPSPTSAAVTVVAEAEQVDMGLPLEDVNFKIKKSPITG